MIIFGPKRIYASVERAIVFMVIVIVGGLLIVSFSIGTMADVTNMAKGILNLGHIRLDDEFTFDRFFGAFVFAGVGGLGNLCYAYYLRDNYLWFALRLCGIGVAATWFFSAFEITALDFFFISAMISGFAMAGYVPMVLYMNLRYLPKPARPKPINIVMVGIGAATYISFAAYTVGSKVATWLFQ